MLGFRFAGTVEDDVYHALSEPFGDIFSMLSAAAGCPPASVRPLEHLPPERLIPIPDCGIKYIARYLAFAKLKALAESAAIVRRELAGVRATQSRLQ